MLTQAASFLVKRSPAIVRDTSLFGVVTRNTEACVELGDARVVMERLRTGRLCDNLRPEVGNMQRTPGQNKKTSQPQVAAQESFSVELDAF